jgi:hypothetical protein
MAPFFWLRAGGACIGIGIGGGCSTAHRRAAALLPGIRGAPEAAKRPPGLSSKFSPSFFIVFLLFSLEKRRRRKTNISWVLTHFLVYFGAPDFKKGTYVGLHKSPFFFPLVPWGKI